MTKNEIACRIADMLVASHTRYGQRGVPAPGTLGDLLRDYERARINEEIAPDAMSTPTTAEHAR